jgi:probable HAF family extracellular repeat protein
MEDLGDLPGGANYSEAKAINDLGVIVGNSGGIGANEAFIWQESTGMVGLGTLPGDHESIALDVNDAGYVVGYSRRNFGGFSHSLTAVVWTPDGSIFPVPNLGERSTWSVAINSTGWVVGQGFDAEGYARGTVWSVENGIVALEALVDDLDQDYRIFDAYGINDRGQIAAWAWSPYGVSAVLLTPVPEPAAVLLLGCAASAIALRRQARPVYLARRCTA